MRQEFSEEVLAQAASFDEAWEKAESIMIKASEKTGGCIKGGRVLVVERQSCVCDQREEGRLQTLATITT